MSRPLIMVAGPYSSSGADEKQRQKNLDVMNGVCLELFVRGYAPLLALNNTLPLVRLDNSPQSFEKITMPLALAYVERCDACLRIGGLSKGADEEVAAFRHAGKPVYFSLEDVPRLT